MEHSHPIAPNNGDTRGKLVRDLMKTVSHKLLTCSETEFGDHVSALRELFGLQDQLADSNSQPQDTADTKNTSGESSNVICDADPTTPDIVDEVDDNSTDESSLATTDDAQVAIQKLNADHGEELANKVHHATPPVVIDSVQDVHPIQSSTIESNSATDAQATPDGKVQAIVLLETINIAERLEPSDADDLIGTEPSSAKVKKVALRVKKATGSVKCDQKPRQLRSAAKNGKSTQNLKNAQVKKSQKKIASTPPNEVNGDGDNVLTRDLKNDKVKQSQKKSATVPPSEVNDDEDKVPYKTLTNYEKTKQILRWINYPELAINRIMSKQYKGKPSDINPEKMSYSLKELDRQHTDWLELLENKLNSAVRDKIVAEIEKMPGEWTCTKCNVEESKCGVKKTIQCRSCLLWFHCECLGIKGKIPGDWFCNEC
ncbi:hypothetical protein QAD02_008305 [Eretmocerus hayati]|uniref:Uncharacterized protein n=1 Tax=Eretmocerus hayati TaxID=131215 RepID=A0ACC2N6P5_9HYME|nr:hypothetical protein QAD02_008305 [Eretmocerus hayati]